MIRVLLVAALCAGCAGDRSREVDLEQQLEGMRRHADDDRRAMHDLENRIFVLEDKLATAEVARQKAADVEPRLPVVKKEKPPAAAEVPPPEDEGGPTMVITLDESGGPISERRITPDSAPRRTAARRAPVADKDKGFPDLATVNEKLPVVPLPKSEPRHAPAAAQAPATPDAMTEYKAAYDALKRRDHQAAIAAFRAFIQKYPDHDYADNAQYWLGETFYDQADWNTALSEFRKVIKRYPDGNKAPDALLKVGFCYAKLGDQSAATDVLTQVTQIYPKTEAAKLAQKRLDELQR